MDSRRENNWSRYLLPRDETRRVIREPPSSGILFTRQPPWQRLTSGCSSEGVASDREREREREFRAWFHARIRADTRPSRGGIRSWTSRPRGERRKWLRGEARVRNATPCRFSQCQFHGVRLPTQAMTPNPVVYGAASCSRGFDRRARSNEYAICDFSPLSLSFFSKIPCWVCWRVE